jgi:hypothetical protein
MVNPMIKYHLNDRQSRTGYSAQIFKGRDAIVCRGLFSVGEFRRSNCSPPCTRHRYYATKAENLGPSYWPANLQRIRWTRRFANYEKSESVLR